jgi:hypothetical protein
MLLVVNESKEWLIRIKGSPRSIQDDKEDIAIPVRDFRKCRTGCQHVTSRVRAFIEQNPTLRTAFPGR